jgi:translation initiation factor 1
MNEGKRGPMPDRLVYSSDSGRVTTCPTCGQPYKRCRCDRPQPASGPASTGDGIVRVMRERKGRGGKTVTLVTGVAGKEESLAALAQQLKKLCGSGGTVKDGIIEIQGDHCEKVRAKLAALGYKVKRVGG